jgi:hypothetical protein
MIGYGNRHQNQRDDIDASDRIAPEVKIAHYQ